MEDILSETIGAFRTLDWRVIDKVLERVGWLSPNSYGRDFCDPLPCPALYIFSRLEFETLQAAPMYIGQTKNLRNRWACHEILPQIEATCGAWTWVTKFFLPWDINRLRVDEGLLISALNPPFNIIGKIRGLQ